MTRLVLIYCQENKGEASERAEHLAAFPKLTGENHLDLLMFWSQAELQELQGTNVLNMAERLIGEMPEDFASLSNAIQKTDSDFLATHGITLERYTWARAIQFSRCFGLPHQGAKLHLVPPYIDLMNHGGHYLSGCKVLLTLA